jgi:hypothetical protein
VTEGPDIHTGVLPDGTDFRLLLQDDPGGPIFVVGDFVVDVDGVRVQVGEVTYRNDGGQGSEFSGTHYFVTAGGWTVFVDFDPDVIAGLGDNAEEVVRASINAEEVEGFPVVRLVEPFQWDYESLPPEVRFGSIVVRRFCGDSAVACSATRAVQAIPASILYPGLAPLQATFVAIESDTPRSPSDPNYLDPGPLDSRLSADLIWTGEEMIVWGGKQARDGLTTLVDGAVFNPATGQWRRIAAFPLQGPQATRAVWGDGEMIVVSHNGTFGYDPESDTWRAIGQGVVPSEWHDRMVYLDEKVYVWARSNLINVVDLANGEARPLDAPPTEGINPASPYVGVLRVVGGVLVAVTLPDNPCAGKEIWELEGDRWVPLAGVSLSTGIQADCSGANQIASVAGTLVAWKDQDHPTAVFSNESWSEFAPIPLGDAEGGSGPVSMGTSHFMVPRRGVAAVFDSNLLDWTVVQLPGEGNDAEIVWTGTEFLAWGIWESFDAWRWAPDLDG